MRILFLIVVLNLLPLGGGACGQINRHAVVAGIGYAIAESGHPLYYAGYNRRISVNVQYGVSAGYTAGITDVQPWKYIDTRIWLGDATVYYLPFARIGFSSSLRRVLRLHTFKLGAGAGIRHLRQYRRMGVIIRGQRPTRFTEEWKNQWSIGFNAVAEYEVVRVQDWYGGLRGGLHTYEGRTSFAFVGVHLGRFF